EASFLQAATGPEPRSAPACRAGFSLGAPATAGRSRIFKGWRHLRSARMRRTVATSRSNSIGLLSNSLHPAASALSRSPASACAARATPGMSRVCGLLLSRRGFPAVDNRHFEVHQDDVRPLGSRHLAALLAVLRRQHLEIAEQLEPHLEHVDVVVVVFDV